MPAEFYEAAISILCSDGGKRCVLFTVNGVVEGNRFAGVAGHAVSDYEFLASGGAAVALFTGHFALVGVG